jgi:dTDP-D-glucose 4,6-dehydratase
LVIDSSKIRRELGWASLFTQQRNEAMAQGLAETAKWFQGSGDRA